MEKYLDSSIGTMRYTLAITTGSNLQVSRVFQNDDEGSIDGDFILTASKKIVILTKDRTPVIVKRWKQLNLNKYLKDNFPFGAASYRPITKVYQDNDGWIWERLKDKLGGRGHFIVMEESNLLFTIFLT